MSEARIKGVPVLRACVTSFRTTENDVRWVVGEMNRIAARDPAAQWLLRSMALQISSAAQLIMGEEMKRKRLRFTAGTTSIQPPRL